MNVDPRMLRRQNTLDLLNLRLKQVNPQKWLDILMRLATKQPHISDTIFDILVQDIVQRKLFIRCFSASPTVESIRQCFERFGEIEEGT